MTPRLQVATAAPTAPTANRLLAALPVRDSRRLIASCEPVELQAGALLYSAGTPMRHVYFPTGACIALLLPPSRSHSALEVSLIGHEGMAGTASLLGVAVAPLHHLVQSSGSALRLSASALRGEMERSPALRLRLLNYVHVKMSQMAQTAACTRFHVVEERLSRWLLMTQDRARTNELQATHAFLAHLLGVRRVGVTKAATALQKLSFIRYNRGSITILDRKGLEARSCGCYRAAVRLYNEILG